MKLEEEKYSLRIKQLIDEIESYK